MNQHPHMLFGVISYPKIGDSTRGYLNFAERGRFLTFPVQRVYWITQWPVHVKRGGHAHREAQQIFFVLSGGVMFSCEAGGTKQSYLVQDPDTGLYTAEMVWLTMEAITDNAVVLVLASEKHNEAEYIRDYEEFKRLESAE